MVKRYSLGWLDYHATAINILSADFIHEESHIQRAHELHEGNTWKGRSLNAHEEVKLMLEATEDDRDLRTLISHHSISLVCPLG